MSAFFKRRGLVRRLGALCLRWRARCSASHVGLVVCFHKVGDPGGDPAVELVPSVGTRLFRRQLRHLRRAYRLVPLSDVRAVAARRRRGARFPVAITFDDDLRSHTEVALPASRAARASACFFLSGASLQSPFQFWWEDLQRLVDREGTVELAHGALRIKSPFDIGSVAETIEMLEPEVRDELAEELHERAGRWPETAGIRAAGVRALGQAQCEIGFHTRGHYLLTTLDDRSLQAELTGWRTGLEQLAGRPLVRLAYPHGKTDWRVADAARKAGFVEAFTSDPRPVAADADPHLLGRIDASPIACGHLALALAKALTHPYPR